MSTSEDTTPTRESPDSPDSPDAADEPTTSEVAEAVAAVEADATQAAEATGAPEPSAAADGDASGAFLSGTPVGAARSTGGVFSAETFGAVGLLLLAPVILNTRLFELFGWFALTNAGSGTEQQVALINAEITVAGGLSALSVLVAAASLFMSGAHTRAWARWASAATVIVGVLFVIAAAVTYVGVPTGS